MVNERSLNLLSQQTWRQCWWGDTPPCAPLTPATPGLLNLAEGISQSIGIHRWHKLLRVAWGDCFLAPWQLLYSVPQGTILYPMLFNIFMTPLEMVIRNLGARFHPYADYTLLYFSITSGSGKLVCTTLPSFSFSCCEIAKFFICYETDPQVTQQQPFHQAALIIRRTIILWTSHWACFFLLPSHPFFLVCGIF